MGDLHSIAYSSSLNGSSLGWDFHNLGVFNADMFQFTENTPPFVSPLMEPDYSTGYLQDALFEFSSKRRRLLLFSDDELKDAANPTMDCYEDYYCLRQMVNNPPCDTISGEPMSTSMTTISEDMSVFTDMKTPEDHQGLSASEALEYSSSSSQKDSVINTLSSSGEKRKKRRMTWKVAYPFTLVKPGGVEGDITLKDINERILMPPTRPVRHPVGDFACRPLVSPDGPGLFGKSVVALTKIHTQGRGTITIIRTRD